MITEFASSSIGGDKNAWIRSMFENIGKYRNLKIAVWFSSADYDDNGQVARPYWLDETPETLETFRNGLAGRYRAEDSVSEENDGESEPSDNPDSDE